MMTLRLLVLLGCCAAATALHAQTRAYPFDGGVLRVVVVPFDTTAHYLEWCPPAESACLLNGVPFLGTDGEEPVTVLESAVLELSNERRIALNVSGMANPTFGGPLDDHLFTVVPDPNWPNRWTVQASMSDGAGTYYARWDVMGGQSVRSLFMSAYDMEALANGE